MDIKSVALIGAGAIGAFFVEGFSGASNLVFNVIAEGERKERLQANGLIINDNQYFFDVKEPSETSCPDMIIISAKYNALPGIIANTLPQMAGPDTIVISAMNGINSEDLIGQKIGMQHMLYAFMRIISARNGNQIRYDKKYAGGLIFGEKDGIITPRVNAVDRLLTECCMPHTVSDNIIQQQWEKYLINIANNMPQAVFGTGYGAYFDSPYLSEIRSHVQNEVCDVAAACGITLNRTLQGASSALASARFSTLQDLDAKRPTEADMFLGVLLDLAHRMGIPVPYCEYTYLAIKTLEEKNAGRFDY